MPTRFGIKVAYGCDFILIATVFILNTVDYVQGRQSTAWFSAVVLVVVLLTASRIYWLRERLEEVGK